MCVKTRIKVISNTKQHLNRSHEIKWTGNVRHILKGNSIYIKKSKNRQVLFAAVTPFIEGPSPEAYIKSEVHNSLSGYIGSGQDP
jgi:hypothetical protein